MLGKDRTPNVYRVYSAHSRFRLVWWAVNVNKIENFKPKNRISNLNENWHEGKVLIEQQNAYIVFVVHTSGLGRYGGPT